MVSEIGNGMRLLAVCDDKIVKTNLVFVGIADAFEQFFDDPVEMCLPDGIEIVFPVATYRNHPRDPQQGEVVADGGLALLELIAKRAHVEFLLANKIHQNSQAGFVGEQLKNLNEIFFEFIGQFRKPWRLVHHGFGHYGFGNVTYHLFLSI